MPAFAPTGGRQERRFTRDNSSFSNIMVGVWTVEWNTSARALSDISQNCRWAVERKKTIKLTVKIAVKISNKTSNKVVAYSVAYSVGTSVAYSVAYPVEKHR